MKRTTEAKPVSALNRTRRRASGPSLMLKVPSDIRLFVSPEGFWKLCLDNPDLRLERTAKGGVIVMALANSGSGRRNSDLSGLLWQWNRQTGEGVAFDSSAGFTLPNGAVVAADAAWIRKERWDALSVEEQEVGFARITPDFVAELRSSGDRPKELHKKMRQYIDQGVRLGWLIDPLEQCRNLPTEARCRDTREAGDFVG